MLDLKTKILRNTSYNVLGAVVALGVGLVTASLVISYTDKEQYALLVLAQLLMSGAALLDFGLSTAFVRHVAECYSRRDALSLNSVVATGIAANLALVVVVFLLYLSFETPMMELLSVPPELRPKTHLVFLLSLAVFSLRMLCGSLIAVPNGLQRMDIPIRAGIVTAALGLLGVFFVLKNGYGIIGVCAVQLFVTCLYHAVVVYKSLRLFPELSQLSVRSVSRQMFFVLFRFGIKLQVSRLCELVNFQLDKLLISALLTLQLVTFYDLGSTVAKASRDMLLNIFVPLLPASSEVQALGQDEQLRRLYRISSRYLVVLAASIFALLVATAELLVYCWLGTGFGQAARVLQLLSFGYLANILTACVSMITQGIGRPELQMKQSLVQLLLNGVLSVLLLVSFGFYGAVLGTTLALISGAIYFFWLFHLAINVPLKAFFREIFLVPLASAFALGLVFLAGNTFFVNTADLSRVYGAALVLGEGALFFVLYYLMLFWQGALERADLKVLKDTLKCAPKLRW